MSIAFDAVFQKYCESSQGESTIISACELAAKNPKALYIFMQRYTHFNGYAGSLVARLASSIGLSRALFNDSSCLVIDQADRGMEIAQKVLAATIDEHSDRNAHNITHRALAQATLKYVGDYANFTVKERNDFSILPEWMEALLDDLIQGYQGMPGNIAALIRAMGFHAASEMLADREYALIDKVIRYDNRGEGFDKFLQRKGNKVEVAGNKVSPWYWIVIHGKHQSSGVEAEHFECALEALNLAAKYAPYPQEQIQSWALQGFDEFGQIQQRLFKGIYQECFELFKETQELHIPIEMALT